MATEKSATVKVRALQAHTYNGKSYDVGDTYDLDAQLVDSLKAQGKAEPASTPAPPPVKPSKPVAPMTTADFGVTSKTVVPEKKPTRARMTAPKKGKR